MKNKGRTVQKTLSFLLIEVYASVKARLFIAYFVIKLLRSQVLGVRSQKDRAKKECYPFVKIRLRSSLSLLP